MAHHLNTNKQFMVGNGILAFAVIFVVVIFIYMSLRLQRENQAERHYIETYTISLVKGFAGDSISLFVNDSLIANKVMQEEAFTEDPITIYTYIFIGIFNTTNVNVSECGHNLRSLAFVLTRLL